MNCPQHFKSSEFSLKWLLAINCGAHKQNTIGPTEKYGGSFQVMKITFISLIQKSLNKQKDVMLEKKKKTTPKPEEFQHQKRRFSSLFLKMLPSIYKREK